MISAAGPTPSATTGRTICGRLPVMWFGVWLTRSTKLELKCMEAVSAQALEDRLDADGIEFVIEVAADSPEQCEKDAEKWRLSRISTPV